MLQSIDWTSIGWWTLHILAVIGGIVLALIVIISLSMSADSRRERKEEKEKSIFQKLADCMSQKFSKILESRLEEERRMLLDRQDAIDSSLTGKICMLKRLFIMMLVDPEASAKLAKFYYEREPQAIEDFITEMTADLPSNETAPDGQKSRKDSKKEEGKKRKG